MLVHDGDPERGRGAGVSERCCSPSNVIDAGVRLDGSGGDVHQRRLAGTVLAEEGVHLAGSTSSETSVSAGTPE